ncbi:MAG: hypothetical protein QOF84_6624 [Streptomyces sp.]|nr:hypothetical protein [Streptomyces sp.]
MALTIHFSSDDFTRVRLAQAPDPMWETLLSMHMLQTSDAPPVFGTWRRRARRQLTSSVREVLRLVPPTGYSPDFLTPAAGEGGLEPGIDALLSTPASRLRRDLLELAAARRRLPPWAAGLAAGDRETVGHLGAVLRGHFGAAVAPHWGRIRGRFAAERAAHARTLAAGDVGGLLGALHPRLVWEPPVLRVTGFPGDRDLHLGGRGMLVLPSFFCWRTPTVLRDPELPVVVVYPMTHDAAAVPDAAGRRSLEPLLGRTRALILEGVAAPDGRTTTELARSAGVSPATASHHTSVLRESGLLVSRRIGGAVLHTLTPLGGALLEGAGGVAF